MFGLFGRRDIKAARKLERVMMAQETAYEAGNWPVFIYAGQQALGLMRTLHQEFGWTENRLEEFLSERRLIKSLFEPGYREKMIAAQDAAGAHY